jgi:hypothetical protein
MHPFRRTSFRTGHQARESLPCFAEAPSEAEGEAEGNLLVLPQTEKASTRVEASYAFGYPSESPQIRGKEVLVSPTARPAAPTFHLRTRPCPCPFRGGLPVVVQDGGEAAVGTKP